MRSCVGTRSTSGEHYEPGLLIAWLCPTRFPAWLPRLDLDAGGGASHRSAERRAPGRGAEGARKGRGSGGPASRGRRYGFLSCPRATREGMKHTFPYFRILLHPLCDAGKIAAWTQSCSRRSGDRHTQTAPRCFAPHASWPTIAPIHWFRKRESHAI